MAANDLQLLFSNDISSAAGTREFKTFLSCNEKIGKILRWTPQKDGNAEELRQLALSQGGLFNASMRQKAWPALLQVSDLAETKRLLQASNDSLHLHQNNDTSCNTELDIIRKDVQRSSMFRCKTVSGSIVKGEQQTDRLQEMLTAVLHAAVSTPVVAGKEKPSYYQGLHDIAFVLLFNLNYDEVTAVAVMRQLLQTHLQDATRKDFGNVLFLLDAVLMPFLQSLDPQVYQALVESEVPLSNAVMPWLITLFAHPVKDQAVASRLMDAFVTSHPLLPFYVAVALLVHPSLRKSILEATYDPCMMHMAIHSLPSQMKNDFEAPTGEELITAQDVIETALDLMRQHPPESLLQLVGKGLQGKPLRRRLRRTRSISVLGLPPAKPTSLRLRAKDFVRAHNFSRRQVAVQTEKMLAQLHSMFSTARNKASKAVVVSRHSWVALQIVLFFVLMPQQYVQEFYQLVQAASTFCSTGSFLSYEASLRTSITAGNKAQQLQGGNIGVPLGYYDCVDDMPCMIKSTSSLSIPELDCV